MSRGKKKKNKIVSYSSLAANHSAGFAVQRDYGMPTSVVGGAPTGSSTQSVGASEKRSAADDSTPLLGLCLNFAHGF